MTVKELQQAIRHKCLDCTGHQPKEIRLGTAKHCSLYPYRMGKKGSQKEDHSQIASICPEKDLLAGKKNEEIF